MRVTVMLGMLLVAFCLQVVAQEKVPPKKETLKIVIGLIVEDCEWRSHKVKTLYQQLTCVRNGLDKFMEKKYGQ